MGAGVKAGNDGVHDAGGSVNNVERGMEPVLLLLAGGDVDRVLDGDLEDLQHAWLVFRKTGKTAASADGKDDLPE